jgi:hypothetical protein
MRRVLGEEIDSARAEAEALFLSIANRLGATEAKRIFEALAKSAPARRELDNEVLLLYHKQFSAENAQWSIRKTAEYVAARNKWACRTKQRVAPEDQHYLFVGPRGSTSSTAIEKQLRRLLAKRQKADI